MQKEVRKAILGYFRAQKPGRILDIPSGSCWLGRELAGSGKWEYYPADLYAESGIPGQKNFRQIDLNFDLPYEDGSFDYVACLEGMEHIENYHHALREFNRILKPQGSLLISTPNPLNVKSRLRFLLQGTFYGFPHLVDMPPMGEHLHMNPVNLSFLISFAGRYGLDYEKAHAINPKLKNYRLVPMAAVLQTYNFIKNFRNRERLRFMRELFSLNVLVNDGLVVSFKKRPPL